MAWGKKKLPYTITYLFKNRDRFSRHYATEEERDIEYDYVRAMLKDGNWAKTGDNNQYCIDYEFVYLVVKDVF